MMPLFPRQKTLCTSVPVKMNIRRAPVQRPTTLETWDTDADRRIGPLQVIPVDSGDVDIRDAMSAAIASQGVEVGTNRELRVHITSTTLPPINLVDLPGTVEYPPDLRERTHGLVDRYIRENSDRSMFLAVIKADSNPCSSGAIQHIMKHGVADRTIGVFTFCDKLDLETEEDRQMLAGWLHNAPGARDNVPLEPYGYVATMSKELRQRHAEESNHARLLRQAQGEARWFRENGFQEDIEAGVVTTQALIARISRMYNEHVHRTFIPDTVDALCERYTVDSIRMDALGLPASPGNLSSGTDLRLPAFDLTRKLLRRCFTEITGEYTSQTLVGLKEALDRALPPNMTVPIRDVAKQLKQMRRTAIEACSTAAAGLHSKRMEMCAIALANNSPPFRLQRFPAFVARLVRFCDTTAPNIPATVLPAAVSFLYTALGDKTSSFITLSHNLGDSPPTVTLRVSSHRAVGVVLDIFATGFSICSTADIDTRLKALVGEVFGDHSQEREACHAERARLTTEVTTIAKATRRLLPNFVPSTQWTARYDQALQAGDAVKCKYFMKKTIDKLPQRAFRLATTEATKNPVRRRKQTKVRSSTLTRLSKTFNRLTCC